MISCNRLLPLVLLCLGLHAKAQTDPTPLFDDRDRALRDTLSRLIAHSNGPIGVAILDVQTGHGCSVNGNRHFPMLSVYKFPLALYVFDQSHKGKLSTDDKLYARRKDWPGSSSPIFMTSTDSVVSLTVWEAAGAILGFSDNTACDLLFERLGGPGFVNDYVHGLGIHDINIVATEKQMAADPKNMYANWCTPLAMDSLLQRFITGQLLLHGATNLVAQWMEGSYPGAKRLKGLLPPNTIVAHKTGTSDTDPNTGLTIATNDVGIIFLPNDNYLCISVFVSDSRASEAIREATIARIARLAYDTYKK
jgi:beta-lactamase class A